MVPISFIPQEKLTYFRIGNNSRITFLPWRRDELWLQLTTWCRKLPLTTFFLPHFWVSTFPFGPFGCALSLALFALVFSLPGLVGLLGTVPPLRLGSPETFTGLLFRPVFFPQRGCTFRPLVSPFWRTVLSAFPTLWGYLCLLLPEAFWLHIFSGGPS